MDPDNGDIVGLTLRSYPTPEHVAAMQCWVGRGKGGHK